MFTRTILFCCIATVGAVIPPAPGCTTLAPIFVPPQDNTSTVFASTSTITSKVDCNSCSLVTSTITYPDGPMTPTTTTTVSDSPETVPVFECLPTTPVRTISSVPESTQTPTAVPFPALGPEADALIAELTSVRVAAILVGADGLPADICGALNPEELSRPSIKANSTSNIDGKAIRDVICDVAAIQKFNPTLYTLLVAANQNALFYVNAAVFAVNYVAGAGGVGPPSPQARATLCSEIDELVLNGASASRGFESNLGTRTKIFVCGGANNGTVPTNEPSH